MKSLFKEPIFVFEMANNHMGSVEHGKLMIQEFGKIAKKFPFKFAFKFQFRNLDTFIHPEFKGKMEHKYVKRFSETRLTREQFQSLKKAAQDMGFVTMCTPFDEDSVGEIQSMGFDILKIASCSFTDWPLLERVAKTDLPIIASTSAATLEQVDGVASFLTNREKHFAFMHCTGEYPTKRENLQLNQIDLLKHRYPHIPIGYSTHEEPDNTDSVMIAVAKGALIFEKHVAVETSEYKKNDYSATPEQVERWLTAAKRAFDTCGVSGQRSTPSEKELADLRQFKRGVFVNRKVKKGEKIDQLNTFLAFPNNDGQLIANEMSKYADYYAETDLEENAAVFHKSIKQDNKREAVQQIVYKAQKLLSDANCVIPGMASLEVSHHYGIDRFNEFGCAIINVVNREYCKKLILVFPEQKHPEQYHKVKEETFVVLYGDVTIKLDGIENQYKRGDIVTVDRGVKHFFTSKNGAVIEEISSTHYKDDSYYTDPSIAENRNRKTIVPYWMDAK
jgi:sialic acid synthase SpsE/mannose-6-phosphate isomerase-like protein (cupin superfamily)